jgi:hypothetical protein
VVFRTCVIYASYLGVVIVECGLAATLAARLRKALSSESVSQDGAFALRFEPISIRRCGRRVLSIAACPIC